MFDFLDKIGLKAVLEAIKAKQADEFARSYNDELKVYLNGQSGDIRALIHQLPIGEYPLNTIDSEYNGITFPIQGYCLISWFPSKVSINNYVYGTLIIRPMSSVGATYICSVYNTYSYTDWEQISTTPIKSTTFSGATDVYSNMSFWAKSENKIPILFECENKNATIFYGNSGYFYAYVTDHNHQNVNNTAVSGIVYYVEV